MKRDRPQRGRGPSTAMHKCPAHGCPVLVRGLFCRGHWCRLPWKMRGMIWRAWNSGAYGYPYIEAVIISTVMLCAREECK